MRARTYLSTHQRATWMFESLANSFRRFRVAPVAPTPSRAPSCQLVKEPLHGEYRPRSIHLYTPFQASVNRKSRIFFRGPPQPVVADPGSPSSRLPPALCHSPCEYPIHPAQKSQHHRPESRKARACNHLRSASGMVPAPKPSFSRAASARRRSSTVALLLKLSRRRRCARRSIRAWRRPLHLIGRSASGPFACRARPPDELRRDMRRPPRPGRTSEVSAFRSAIGGGPGSPRYCRAGCARPNAR